MNQIPSFCARNNFSWCCTILLPEDRRASCGRRSRILSAGGNQAGSHPSTLRPSLELRRGGSARRAPESSPSPPPASRRRWQRSGSRAAAPPRRQRCPAVAAGAAARSPWSSRAGDHVRKAKARADLFDRRILLAGHNRSSPMWTAPNRAVKSTTLLLNCRNFY